MNSPLLIVGEVIVDFALASLRSESKIRFGGIVHAARGLWALDIPFAVAAVCPGYLRAAAMDYLREIGCVNFFDLGEVLGAPNVMVIRDLMEVGDHGYEDLLCGEKWVKLNDLHQQLQGFSDALIFPGSFNLAEASTMFCPNCKLHIDVAYDIEDASDLAVLQRQVDTVLISTSSDLFRKIVGPTDTVNLWAAFDAIGLSSVVLKENRGGARVFVEADHRIESVPAQLGITRNSVGVGDVFSATYVALKEREGVPLAAWQAARTSSAYAQTNDLDWFRLYVQRALNLSYAQMVDLGGVYLPWERRQEVSIYLAAPDFSYGDRRAVDEALRSLEYHNFRVRRPVLENGELSPDASPSKLLETFHKDVELLAETALVFAVPTGRDPGTLVEIGIALERGIPVVVYDPDGECRNTMVIAGAKCYSQSLDECLNAVFRDLSCPLEG